MMDKHANRIQRTRVAAEAILVTIVFFVVYGIRSDNAGLDHFDEGAYATAVQSILGGHGDAGFVPDQHLISPPLHYTSGVLVAHVTGSSPHQALLFLNRLFGALTLGLFYYIGTRWGTKLAGLAAALGLGCSDYFIALVRSGLTDVHFHFWFVLAVYMLSKSLSQASLVRGFVAGLITGLAWLTKYHGWLVGVLGLVTLLRWSWVNQTWSWRHITVYLVFGFTAVSVYMPWLLSLANRPDGLASLARNHQAFLTGTGIRWFSNAAWQNWQFIALDGWGSRLSILVLAAASFTFQRKNVTHQRQRPLVLMIPGLLVGTPLFLATFGLTQVLTRRYVKAPVILLIWVFLFLFLTPFYRPYARLLLPLVSGSLLLGALCFDRASRDCFQSLRGASLWTLAALLFVLSVGTGLVFRQTSIAQPWAFTRSMDDAVSTIRASLGNDTVHVLGEPCVTYYDKHRGNNSVLVRDPKSLFDHVRGDSEGWIVFGHYGRLFGLPRRFRAGEGAEWKLVMELPLQVKDIRRFDDTDPFDPSGSDRQHSLEVWHWRHKK